MDNDSRAFLQIQWDGRNEIDRIFRRLGPRIEGVIERHIETGLDGNPVLSERGRMMALIEIQRILFREEPAIAATIAASLDKIATLTEQE